MTIEATDRGDEILEPALDVSGETDVQKQEVVEKVEEPKEVQIPKKRFDEAVGKARREAEAAAKRADELEEKLRAQEGQVDAEKIEGEIDELEEKLDAAKADGNKELATQLRKQIRSKMQLISDARAEVKASYATALAVEKINYDTAVKSIESDHPELNPDSDDYDEDLMTELLELKEAFEKAGHASSEAVKRAVKTVFRGAKEPEKKEVPEKKEADEGAKRKEAAAKKALEAAGKQPATTKGAAASDVAGKTGTPKDVAKLSEKQFTEMDEAERKRLRGDEL